MTTIEGATSIQLTVGRDRARARVAGILQRRSLRERLAAGDLVAALAAWAAVMWAGDGSVGGVANLVVFLGAAAAATILAMHWQQLYKARVAAVRSDEVARVGRAACASVIAGAGASHLLDVGLDGGALLAGGVATFLLVTYRRGRFGLWVRKQRAEGSFGRNVLVVGATSEATSLVDMLNDWPELGYVPVAYAGAVEADAPAPTVPWAGGTEDVVEAVRATGAGGVVIAASSVGSTELSSMVRQLHRHGIHVQVSSGITGMHHRRLRVQSVGYEPLIYVEPASLSAVQGAAKRALDIALATIGLIVATPVLLAAALAIKLGDGGPVLFRQQRVGREGTLFAMLKLRTMCVDAEERLVELRGRNEREGPLFKLTDDPRVTRVGRFLRATSLDELPQLLNVLGGSMSLVGPRPALPSEVAQFEHADDRHAVKPGITGLWQVEARDKSSFAAYERLDMFYVENWSVWLDVAVLLRTGRVVLRRARQASSAAHHLAGSPSLSSVAGEPEVALSLVAFDDAGAVVPPPAQLTSAGSG